jgi:hypothetical protein
LARQNKQLNLARRRLYTLTEILDAEIQARDQLEGQKLNMDFNDDFDNFIKFPNEKEPRNFDEILFPPQNSKRSSNLLRLANQAARGFGK